MTSQRLRQDLELDTVCTSCCCSTGVVVSWAVVVVVEFSDLLSVAIVVLSIAYNNDVMSLDVNKKVTRGN
jgi:hypothetical protein